MALSLTPAAAAASTATPNDIEEYVAETSPTDNKIASASPRQLLGLFVRCFEFRPDATYCMHLGWSDPTELDSYLDEQAAQPQESDTGGVGLLGEVQAFAKKPQAERLEEELRQARDAKEVLPDIIAQDRAVKATINKMAKLKSQGAALALQTGTIMTNAHYHQQETATWCGSATTQMTAHYKGVYKTQRVWHDNHVRDSPSAETIKYHLNTYGGYRPTPYAIRVIQRVGGYGPAENLFWLTYNHTEPSQNVKKPIPAGVMLKVAYFNHIRYNHSYHWQVIRGNTTNGVNPHSIHFFEPFHEARWNSGGYASGGAKQRTYREYYNAVKANANRVLI